MSRVGRQPIAIPDKVQVTVRDGHVAVRGPKGNLKLDLPEQITGEAKEGQVKLVPCSDDKKTRALHGMARALVANMVTGVSNGFEKVLEIQGTGYRASVSGNVLEVNLGFSHPVRYTPPEGIEISVERNTTIAVRGIDKQAVGEVAAKIRSYRPPEPYKGKGVRYRGEFVKRKVGKKNV